MRAKGHWLETTCTWWHPGGPSGVIIAPPIGYEYFSSHATLKTLADALADRGFTVVRFDYDGTGDSAGEAWDTGRLASWRKSLRDVVDAVHASGCTHVSVVGLRFGATLALELDGIDAVVALAPVIAGKRWMRELRMLGIPTKRPGFVAGGTVFSDETVAAMAGVTVSATPTKRVLLLERPSAPLAGLKLDGSDVTLEAATGSEMFLDQPSEEAVVPVPLIARIVDWLGAPLPGSTALTPRATTTMKWRDGSVDERFVEIAGLPGIRGSGQNGQPLVVFLNSGSEVHVGPGRAWVDYSRALNLAGYPTLRIDWPGWGENVEGRVGRPYDQQSHDATLRLVNELRASGERVVLAGLCAGAWTAVKAGQQSDIAGIVAFNPHLFWNERNYRVIARIAEAGAARAPERNRQAKLARYGLWSALDVLRIRPQAARWLTGLSKRRVRTLLLFSQGDDGIVYLRSRLARRLAKELARGVVTVAELDDLDHQMYHEWRRPEVIATVLRFLATL